MAAPRWVEESGDGYEEVGVEYEEMKFGGDNLNDGGRGRGRGKRRGGARDGDGVASENGGGCPIVTEMDCGIQRSKQLLRRLSGKGT